MLSLQFITKNPPQHHQCFEELQTVVLFCTIWITTFGTKNSMAAKISVNNFGAKGDGNTDDTKAFKQAWSSLCGDNSGNPTLIVPSGTFLVRPLQFQGPCKSSSLHIKVLGTIVAPKSIDGWTGCEGGEYWIYFKNISGLTIDGTGQFDGQGALWWHKSVHAQGCNKPSSLHFIECNGLRISGTTHLNSPQQHIGIHECNNVDIGHISISSPKDSPNTDGIDISGSRQVNIHDSSIQSGDDCVAINGGSIDINVTGVNCGPGHGISIGSLGDDNSRDTVEQVHVINCNITGTENGVRIKTQPGGSGYAKQILFQQIKLVDVKNPIIIDQHYCNGKYCTLEDNSASAVQVSSVTYNNIHGSSASKIAIKLDCSEYAHCTNITMNDVSITGYDVEASCNNAQGTFISTSPNVHCQ